MHEDSSVSVLLMKRNCSFTPRQVGWFYLSMVIFSSLIAGYFYWRGAWIIVPFTGLELLALGIALIIYARHATDYEKIVIQDGYLNVEVVNGHQTIQKHWPLLWVRIESPVFLKDAKSLKDPKNHLVTLEYGDDSVCVGLYIFPEKRQELADKIRRARAEALH